MLCVRVFQAVFLVQVFPVFEHGPPQPHASLAPAVGRSPLRLRGSEALAEAFQLRAERHPGRQQQDQQPRQDEQHRQVPLA